jgi:hypothetical protein
MSTEHDRVYQVQRMTQANERFSGPRNPIGVPRLFAGGGDATGWTQAMSRGETPVTSNVVAERLVRSER